MSAIAFIPFRSMPILFAAATARGRRRKRPWSRLGSITVSVKRMLCRNDALGSSPPVAGLTPTPSGELVPGGEGVRDALEGGTELRMVAQEHIAHAVALHPFDPLRRVDVGRVIVGEEPVAL